MSQINNFGTLRFSLSCCYSIRTKARPLGMQVNNCHLSGMDQTSLCSHTPWGGVQRTRKFRLCMASVNIPAFDGILKKMFTKRESMTGGGNLGCQLSEMMWQRGNSSKDYGKTARTFVVVGVRIKVEIGRLEIHAMRTSAGYSEMAVSTTLACIATLGVVIRLLDSLGQEEATTWYLSWFMIS